MGHRSLLGHYLRQKLLLLVKTHFLFNLPRTSESEVARVYLAGFSTLYYLPDIRSSGTAVPQFAADSGVARVASGGVEAVITRTHVFTKVSPHINFLRFLFLGIEFQTR